MQHKKFGYEFSSKGESRVFDAGDAIEDSINDNPVVHRRYLKEGQNWRTQGFEPNPATQAEEHAAIFTYNQTACSFDLASPENAWIESDDDDAEDDTVISELKEDLAELFEQVTDSDEDLTVADEEVTKPVVKKTTKR